MCFWADVYDVLKSVYEKLLATVVHSDIRGLVTDLTSLRRGAASLYHRGSSFRYFEKSLIGARRVLPTGFP